MGSINKIILMGTLGADPELRQSSGGKPYVSISLATHRRIQKETGERKAETQWHRVMVWGRTAEVVATHCTKGTPILLEGHMTSYKKEVEGRVTYQVGIVAENVQLIPGTKAALSGDRSEDLLSALGSEGAAEGLGDDTGVDRYSVALQ